MANELRTLFQDIADAIKDKTGSTDTMKPAEFPSKIAEIEVGGGDGAVVEKDINFFDYDGTLLYSYTIAEANALTELPPLPEQEGLICQGWNYSIEDVKESTYPMTIGAMYTTDDGKTRINIEYPSEKSNELIFRWQQTVTNGVIVDWGDGSETISVSGTGLVSASHAYTAPGNYTVSFDVADGCTFTLGGGTSSTQLCQTNLIRYFVKSINIGNGNVVICNYAFSNFTALRSISIPSSIVSIGTNAFQTCSSLKAVIIPNGVTSIGNNTFASCATLSCVSICNNVNKIAQYAFSTCGSLTSIAIPDSVTNLGNSAFESCRSLQSIIIPASVTAFGSYMFRYCSSLKSVILQNRSAIGSSAFTECPSLMSVAISENVTTIGSSAFTYCYALPNITIPTSITSIGNNVFTNCWNCCTFDFSNFTSIPTLGTSVFQTGSYLIIKVPSTLLSSWKTATNWSTYADYMVGV